MTTLLISLAALVILTLCACTAVIAQALKSGADRVVDQLRLMQALALAQAKAHGAFVGAAVGQVKGPPNAPGRSG